VDVFQIVQRSSGSRHDEVDKKQEFVEVIIAIRDLNDKVKVSINHLA
jgi:hypothetical protein